MSFLSLPFTFSLVIIFETMIKVSIRELEPKCFHLILGTADQAESANPPEVRPFRVKCELETALNISPLYSRVQSLNDGAAVDPGS
jgi:hypothetical protein